jgi:nicotinate phosphoribosyltransferase
VARAASNDDPDAPLRPVAKKSMGGKTSVGGRKWAARRPDAGGIAEAEVVGTGELPESLKEYELQVPLMRGGVPVGREPIDAARDRHIAARARLPLSATQLSRGEPVLPTEYTHVPTEAETTPAGQPGQPGQPLQLG